MSRPSASPELRVLLIEDSRAEAVYIERTLTRGGPQAARVTKAYITRTDVKRAMGLGACGYITKPVTEDALARRLGKIVPSPLYSRPDTTQLVWGNVPPKSLI